MTLKEAREVFTKYLKTGWVPNPADLHYAAEIAIEAISSQIQMESQCGEAVYYYHQSGKKWMPDERFDLFIITPEEELTRFEEGLNAFLFDFAHTTVDPTKYIKKNSGVLLSLARQQLQPEIDAAIEKAYKTADEVVFHKGYEQAEKDTIERAGQWLFDNFYNYDRDLRHAIEADFRKAMDEQTEDNEERFESIDNAFRRGREVGFREGVESVKQPAEWSEEDEELREELIKLAEYYSKTEDETEFKPHINWLKSLPERFNLQPKQEWNWNDEDFEKFRGVLSKEAFLDEITSTRVAKKLLGFLKHYSPNPHWKPSEEQMDILDKVYHYLWADRNATADMQDGLGDFIDDLKKLQN